MQVHLFLLFSSALLQSSRVQCFLSTLLCSNCARTRAHTHTHDIYTGCKLLLASLVPPQGLLAYAAILLLPGTLQEFEHVSIQNQKYESYVKQGTMQPSSIPPSESLTQITMF
eukprot:1151824-Pelagomonas_calceolata.AAC.4